ncbi:hypothetical protein, partial [Thauera aminoaromatica]|uniref:hypothetical protein n=1 Tax=Thauera aminoaromatica TaxID=164330 RepID=UPI0035AE9AD1
THHKVNHPVGAFSFEPNGTPRHPDCRQAGSGLPNRCRSRITGFPAPPALQRRFRRSDASRDRAIPQAMRGGKGGMVDIATCVAPTGNAVSDLAMAHDQRDGFRRSDASRDCPNHPAAFITT